MPNTADYLNQLIDDRNDLADNLVTMGVAASHSETFTELVPKVLTIPVGSTVVAFIIAKYRVGKTVTCTDGVTTLTSDTSGNYIFELNATGTWTVSSDYFTTTVTAQYGNSYLVDQATKLIYSNGADILAEVYQDNFNISSAEIANDIYAHNYTDLTLSPYNDLVTTSTTHIYYDRGTATNDALTIYFVGKSLSSSGDPRIVTVLKANAVYQAPGIFQRNGKVYTTYYSSDVNTGVSTTSNIFACALSINGSTAKYYVNGTYTEAKNGADTTGRYVYFSGSGDPDNPDVATTFGGTFNICEIGIVNGAETDTVINNNLQYLLSQFAN